MPRANLCALYPCANSLCLVPFPAAGSVSCWGANDFGQLGAGSSASSIRASAAVAVSLGSNVLAAELDAQGHHHACVRTLEGRVKCW